MVLELDEAIKGMSKIMSEHKIKFDRSPNLRQDGNIKEYNINSPKSAPTKRNRQKKIINKQENKNKNDNLETNNKAMVLIDEITKIFDTNQDK
eukprot:CAMPEP_0201589356 /NCGR_PEP_ID=MMETSP0190_2-20130828/165613_1 /ASSEMBLY_ACC=CAM_ASM_000263 /TAXON_ID=37353 /ORGANISM="Rosalina sp." /LENGTH=92 /DNA_ID=CAMNT_0048043345 /DNA_START=36 /DNA_END=311 /DNA_ORIENTATION=-